MKNILSKSARFALLCGLIFLLSLCVRLYDLDDAPLDFHPARQFHSALIARAIYLNHGGDLPNEDATFEHEAIMRGTQEPRIEPPVFEYLSAYLYQHVGDADLRIPRLCAIFFWLMGALGLLRLSRRFLNPAGATLAVSFFLFLPYGIQASRSFQPDPLMTALTIWALEFMCAWAERPAWRRAALVGLIAGLAIFIKQTAIFFIGISFAALLLSSRSFKQTLTDRRIWLIVFLCLAPIALYNYWGCFIDGFLKQQYQGRFFWEMLLSPSLYIQWLRKIDQVFTLPLFFLSLGGVFLIRPKEIRAMFLGFFAGYILYGLTLPHHIGTHDYYQISAFPLVSVGFGSLMDRLFAASSEKKGVSRVGLGIALVSLFFWWTADGLMELHRRDYRQWQTIWKTLTPELEPYDGQISSIGLMKDDGASMIYWGQRTPIIWSENVEKLDECAANAKISQTMRNRLFFIVTDFEGFYRQPRLQRWLNAHAQLKRQTADYIIYDLGDARNE